MTKTALVNPLGFQRHTVSQVPPFGFCCSQTLQLLLEGSGSKYLVSCRVEALSAPPAPFFVSFHLFASAFCRLLELVNAPGRDVASLGGGNDVLHGLTEDVLSFAQLPERAGLEISELVLLISYSCLEGSSLLMTLLCS